MADFCYIHRTDEAAQTAPPALTTQPIGAVVMADESLNPSGEIWKPIPGLPNCEASSFGRVRYFKRGWRPHVQSWRVLKGWVETPRKRYRRFVVRIAGRKYAVHRLVLLAFVGPCPPGMQGCHHDDDSSNNHLENLRWDTQKANAADAIRNGVLFGPKTGKGKIVGSANHRSLLSEADVRSIRAVTNYWGVNADLARQFNVCPSAILSVRSRRTWRHL